MNLSSSSAASSTKQRDFKQRIRQGLRKHFGAIAVGLLFSFLALYYNVTIPLWESDHEYSHYYYVRYILDQRRLPRIDSLVTPAATADRCGGDPATVLAPSHEFRQPPLYYLFGAAFVFWVDVHDGWQVAANPHVFSDPIRTGMNVAVHSSAEAFPWRGTVLAVHVLRLLSGLIGLAGLSATYLMGLLLFSGRRYLAAATMAVNAFIPQYLFSSAVINNDILVGALGSWCVCCCAYAVLRNPGPGPLVAAAGAAMLALATKYTGLPLVPLVAVTTIVCVVQSWRQGHNALTAVVSRVGGVVAVIGLPALVWLARNTLLYGHPVPVLGELPSVPAVWQGLFTVNESGKHFLEPARAAVFAFMTFWGLFGNDLLALPTWLLTVLTGVTLIALAGLVFGLARSRWPQPTRALVVAALVFIVTAWAVSTFKAYGTSEPRGRYLLPIYSTVSLLLVLGVDSLLPGRLKAGVWVLGSAICVLAALVPAFVIRPAYALPPRVASAALLPGEQSLYATFGDFAELVGYRLEPERVSIFAKLKVTLVWRALNSTVNNYTVSLHLLDASQRPHGAIHAFPGRGNFATSLWQPGDVFRDTYELYLEPSARAYLPSAGQVKVTMHCYADVNAPALTVTNLRGQVIGDAIQLDRVKLIAKGEPTVTENLAPSAFVFGDQIGLRSYTISPQEPLAGETLVIELQWQALTRPAADYTLFAHLVDDQGVVVARHDQPLTDLYYPSGLWDPGEQISHTHRLPLPADLPGGQYTLFLGLYDPRSGQRLPVRDIFGMALPDDRFPAARVQVGLSSVSGLSRWSLSGHPR